MNAYLHDLLVPSKEVGVVGRGVPGLQIKHLAAHKQLHAAILPLHYPARKARVNFSTWGGWAAAGCSFAGREVRAHTSSPDQARDWTPLSLPGMLKYTLF